MSRIDNIGQNGNTGEHYGEPLTWPIDKSLIGRKVRFDGYVTGGHDHWGYVVGEEYTIGMTWTIGPVNNSGAIPGENFDFKFTLLPAERTVPDYYAYDDCGSEPTEPIIIEYRPADVAFKKPETPATDLVNHPPHYQTDGIECIDAIRASLGLDGFVAYCRGNAIKYSWRAGKKDDTAQDLRKAAWYLNRAADELLKNSERSAGVNK